jgi:hypothetical protein
MTIEPPLGARGFWLAGIVSAGLATALTTAYFLAVSRAEVGRHHGAAPVVAG